MENILYFEKNLFVTRVVRSGLQSMNCFSCDCVSSLPEARHLIEEKQSKYFLSIAETPSLDEAARELIDYLKAQGLPPIILTNEFTEAIREKMTTRGIIDYIIKDEHFAENLMHTVRRIHKNVSTKIIVVDDSPVCREQVKTILEHQKLKVLETGDGREALRWLDEQPDVKLLLTDFNMPGMNGVELIRRIRKSHPINQLAIIGFSDADNPSLSARLLKSGANDFLFKSFIGEELYLRVIQNLEMVRHIEELKLLSNTDYLTRLYNRRFFFEVGGKIFENVNRKNLYMTLAMLDIDHFKNVNDRYGHDAGDLALKHVAGILTQAVRAGDIVSRYGGEEFCIIAINVNKDTAPLVFERIRSNVAASKISLGTDELSITVSIGVATVMGETLEETIIRADKLMYEAKAGGRNRVMIE
jgi:diguanylate cyclase (GGDEF)-like protein